MRLKIFTLKIKATVRRKKSTCVPFNYKMIVYAVGYLYEVYSDWENELLTYIFLFAIRVCTFDGRVRVLGLGSGKKGIW